MKKSELRQIIREEISKALQEQPDVSTDKEIVKGIIGKTIINTDNGTEFEVINIIGFEKYPNNVMVNLGVLMGGEPTEIQLDIESIIDLLLGKDASKIGYSSLKLK